jgi:hypothetical protein
VSTTDPDTTYFSQGDRAPTLGYFDNYLINNGRCVVLAVEATDARPSQEIALGWQDAHRLCKQSLDLPQRLQQRALVMEKLSSSPG